MRLEDLRAKVHEELGPRLERATLPALRAFVEELQAYIIPGPQAHEVLTVDDAPATYGAAMREYFGGVLNADADAAAVSLWLTAIELWLGALEIQEFQGRP